MIVLDEEEAGRMPLRPVVFTIASFSIVFGSEGGGLEVEYEAPTRLKRPRKLGGNTLFFT